MQKWEYQVVGSHLDPAELVIALNESGRQGWELVAIARMTDYYPPEIIDPAASPGETDEIIPIEAFRYIFKRPLEEHL